MRLDDVGTVMLGLVAGLMVLSGVAGIAQGGTPAQAGWWLVVVGCLILVAVVWRRAEA